MKKGIQFVYITEFRKVSESSSDTSDLSRNTFRDTMPGQEVR